MAAAAVFNPSASTESEEWFDANAAPAPGTAGAVVFAAGGPQRSSPSGEQGASGQHSPDPTGVTPAAAPLTPAAVATESPVGSRAPHARSPVPGGVSPAANPVPAPGASELLWRPLPPSVLDWVCFSTLSDSLFQPRRELVSEYRMRAGAGARAGDRHNTSSRIGLQHSLRPRRSKDFIAENIRACSSGSGSQPRPGAGPHSPDRTAMSLSGVFDGDGAPPADAPTAAATQESPRGKSPRARASTVQSPTRLLYLTARSPPGAAPVSPSPRAHRHHSGRSGTALSPSDSLSPFPSHFLAPPAPPADLRAPFVAGLRQLLHECACSLKEVRFSWFTRFRRRVASPPCVVYLAHAVCVVLSVHPRVEPVEEPSNTEEAVYLLCHPKLRELLSEADPRWYSAAARLQLTSLLKEIKASMQHAPVPDARPLLTWLATFGKLLLFYHQHAHFQPALLRRPSMLDCDTFPLPERLGATALADTSVAAPPPPPPPTAPRPAAGAWFDTTYEVQ